MSNYCLCDTCGKPHVDKGSGIVCLCGVTYILKKLVISDNQTPHEVCKYWKPKEDA